MRDFGVLFFTFLLIVSCSTGEKSSDLDKEPILENIAYKLAIPAYENSLKSFVSLDSAIVFLEEYNNGYNLSVVQDLWIVAATKWARTAPYNFGPIDELLIENNFHYYPQDTSKLSSAVKKFSGEQNFINALGSNSRGLGALEYLLFTDTIQSKEISFSKILSKDLIKLNQQILNEWKSDYAKKFITNTGNNISASITVLTNQWIELAERVKNNKIGSPAGKIPGIDKNFMAVPAPFSESSIAIIAANLSELQIAFNGDNGKGVDDYLNDLNIEDADGKILSDKINSKFQDLLDLLDESDKSLADLINQDSEKLDQMYLESLNLTILLKTDMMGQLGLITTFSDSDGD